MLRHRLLVTVTWVLAAALVGSVLLGFDVGSPAEPGGSDGEEAQPTTDDAVRSDLDIGNDFLAKTLAAALRAVYEHHAGSARPIPADVREQLADEYGSELSRARYVVSPAAVQLLATIDRFQGTDFGKGMHALAIDDLVLLSTDPAETDSPYTLWIWAHELHHVRQYHERDAILEFARDYLRDCDAIEQAADERANRALGMSVSMRHCLQ